MDFDQVAPHLSFPRLSKYLHISKGNKQIAIQLYKQNIRVSKAFLPLLSTLEVVLRNGINEALSAHFSDPDWIINQKTGFMIDSTLKYFDKRKRVFVQNEFLLLEVVRAEKRLRKSRTPVSTSKIIAEQTFGFWTDLFELQHYKLLKGRPIKMFRNLPTGYGRREIYDVLNKIRIHRNRIYHNEPICFDSNGRTCFGDAIGIHALIMDVFSWITPDLLCWLTDIDDVAETINSTN
ncbi:MAG TPA: hypothetical protein VIG72_13530 [Pontibacter sp.]